MRRVGSRVPSPRRPGIGRWGGRSRTRDRVLSLAPAVGLAASRVCLGARGRQLEGNEGWGGLLVIHNCVTSPPNHVAQNDLSPNLPTVLDRTGRALSSSAGWWLVLAGGRPLCFHLSLVLTGLSLLPSFPFLFLEVMLSSPPPGSPPRLPSRSVWHPFSSRSISNM